MIITPCVVVCVVGCSNFPLSDAKMKPRVVSDDAVIKLHSKNSSGEMMIEEYMMRVGVGQSGQVLFPSSPGDYFPNACFFVGRCLPRRKMTLSPHKHAFLGPPPASTDISCDTPTME